MASGQLGKLMGHLRRLAAGPATVGRCDAELLGGFLHGPDESAFAELVERHGPMVRSVCLRVLNDSHDAEDAFQATFILLVRKAGSIRKRASLGSWLHGAAYRISQKARATAARRRQHERQVASMTAADPLSEVVQRDLRAVLDAELGCLPEKYRAPLVLCYLEGKSSEEAAQQLGWTTGTLWGRLARARELLRRRLGRRGVALSVGTLATALSETATPAAVPAPWVTATIQAASLAAAGQALGATGSAALVEGVLRDMFLTKVKIAGVLVMLAVVSIGAGFVLHQAQAARAPIDPNGPAGDGAGAIKLPVDQAVIHHMRVFDKPFDALKEGAVVLESPPADRVELASAFLKAREADKKDRQGFRTGAKLSIVTAGPVLDSPDQVSVRSLVRRGQKLELQVAHTSVRSEGAQLRRNIIWRPLVQVPLDVADGTYSLEVTWLPIPSDQNSGKPPTLPAQVLKVAFSVGEAEGTGR